MYKMKKYITIAMIFVVLLCSISVTFNKAIANDYQNNDTQTENILEQESTHSQLNDFKEEQLKTIEDYQEKYGSDTYGMVAYILHLVQWYSIPIAIVGIAVCAIYEFVIGIKRLDIRDKGFNTMIAIVTLFIICQVLPLIFAIVVKSTD